MYICLCNGLMARLQLLADAPVNLAVPAVNSSIIAELFFFCHEFSGFVKICRHLTTLVESRDTSRVHCVKIYACRCVHLEPDSSNVCGRVELYRMTKHIRDAQFCRSPLWFSRRLN